MSQSPKSLPSRIRMTSIFVGIKNF
jgi:hypothetical protein